MDKTNHTCADSSSSNTNATYISSSSSSDPNTTTSSTRDQFLRHLNKLSHKISKPVVPTSASFPRRPPSEPPVHLPLAPPLQQQPPVYNISKSDFRDVVQKLTGSPAHERPVQPPPVHAPKPASSRLQRIRPPPLAQLSNRPPPLLNCAVPHSSASFGGFFRPPAPHSPLPPLPTCHAAAESPISAYMRFLHNSIPTVDSDPKFGNQTVSFPTMQPPPSSSDSMLPPPSSPLPLGCLPSPKSPCPLLSPKLIFSPTGPGFPQLPLSPTVPSPK